VGIALGMAGLPVEGAEVAVHRADVGVVRVGVDDVGDDRGIRLAGAGLPGERPQLEERGVGQEMNAFLRGQALAVENLVLDRGPHETSPRGGRSFEPFCTSGRGAYTAAPDPA